MKTRDLRNVFMSGAALRHVLLVDDDGDGGGAGGAPPADPPGAGDEGGGDPPDSAGAEGAGAEGGEGGDEPPAPKPHRVPWQAKRIDALTAQSKAEKERADQLERDLKAAQDKAAAYEALYGRNEDPPAGGGAPPAPAGGRTFTEADVEARAKEIAEIQTLNQKLEGLFDEGAAKHGDAWQKQVTQAGQAFGADLMQRVDFFKALSKLPNAVDVYHSLTGDLDHMSDVLAMAPLDLGMELANMSAKLNAKPKAPPVSRVPAPIEPIDGQGSSSSDDLGKMSMEDFARTRERQREERFKSRHG